MENLNNHKETYKYKNFKMLNLEFYCVQMQQQEDQISLILTMLYNMMLQEILKVMYTDVEEHVEVIKVKKLKEYYF